MNTFNLAKAYIKGSSTYPNIYGIVYFKALACGVLITAQIYNLPRSNQKGRFFGFHIHEGNSCSGLDFIDSKNHLNLTNTLHSFHTGDLPPLIENNGYAYMQVLINKFTIEDILGKVVIIHEGVDDFTTNPSGNSKTKIACGKIYLCSKKSAK